MMLKKCLFPILITFLLVGCSNITGKETFYKSIDSLEAAAQQEDWITLEELSNELDNTYKRQEWKVQLLGDESEYENLQESIDRLKIAIEAQDSLETKLEISTIKTLLQFIYSL